MNTNTRIPIICSLAFLLATHAFAAESAPSATNTTPQAAVLNTQTTCPIMGEAIDKNLYVDHKGKRIYVCCSGCIAQIKKNPDFYIQQLEKKGILLDRTPAKTK